MRPVAAEPRVDHSFVSSAPDSASTPVMGLCFTPGCRVIQGWPHQVCMWQGLRNRWGRPGKLMVLSFGKEVVIGKLASHSYQNLCLPDTNKSL